MRARQMIGQTAGALFLLVYALIFWARRGWPRP